MENQTVLKFLVASNPKGLNRIAASVLYKLVLCVKFVVSIVAVMMGLSDPILEDAIDVIKSGNWKDRQYNDQKKRTKRQNTEY